MGNITEVLNLVYGDNCIALFNKHGFVWDWQVIDRVNTKVGYIVTANGKLKGYDNIRDVAPIYNIYTTSGDTSDIMGYAFITSELLDAIRTLPSGKLLIANIEVLVKDDYIKAVKAKIRQYAIDCPDITIVLEGLVYRLRKDIQDNLYFKLETSRLPRRSI